MGARYSDLKKENAELRLVAKAFAEKVSLKPGDMLILHVRDPEKLGHAFGIGWGGLHRVKEYLQQVAGGPVGTMASVDGIHVENLDRPARAKLRQVLDALDAQADTFTPKK